MQIRNPNIEIRNKFKIRISNVQNISLIWASGKSHLFRHSGESRNPELLENPGFRVALCPLHHAVQGFACPEWRVWGKKIDSQEPHIILNFVLWSFKFVSCFEFAIFHISPHLLLRYHSMPRSPRMRIRMYSLAQRGRRLSSTKRFWALPAYDSISLKRSSPWPTIFPPVEAETILSRS